MLVILIFNLTCCGDKNSYQHCEMIISLPDGYEAVSPDEPFIIYDASGAANIFTLSNVGSIDMAFMDSVSVVSLCRISKEAAYDEGIPPIMSQLEFAKFYLGTSGVVAKVMTHLDIPYYTYTKTSDSGGEFNFLMTFYTTPNAYFIVSYITTADRASAQKESFLDIAERVSFE